MRHGGSEQLLVSPFVLHLLKLYDECDVPNHKHLSRFIHIHDLLLPNLSDDPAVLISSS